MISIEKGKLGESKVAGYFLAQGYHVFLPVFSYPECDMVIMKDGITQRVEVKATSSKTKGGNFMVSLRRIRNNSRHYTIHKFDGSCADVLAVYIVDEDRVVLFKANELNGRTAVTIKKEGSVMATKRT